LVISIRDRQSFDDDDSNNNNNNKLSNILRKYKIKDLQKAAVLYPVQAVGESTKKNFQPGK
jgi:hypothetical protein